MKRVITCATNKRESLDALKSYEETIFYPPMYHVEVNYKLNQVEVYDRYGYLALEVRPDEEPVTLTRYRFVEATEDDIKSGKKLYVRAPYTSHTTQQVGRPSDTVPVTPWRHK